MLKILSIVFNKYIYINLIALPCIQLLYLNEYPGVHCSHLGPVKLSLQSIHPFLSHLSDLPLQLQLGSVVGLPSINIFKISY